MLVYIFFFFSSRRRHTRSVSAFLLNRSSDLTENIINGFNRTLDAINNVFRKFSAFHDETGRLNVDRSEERRVGKECRRLVSACPYKQEEVRRLNLLYPAEASDAVPPPVGSRR